MAARVPRELQADDNEIATTTVVPTALVDDGTIA